MPQYFADIKETEFFLMDEEAHHASVVARHQEGDEIRVFDGTGRQYTARIDRAPSSAWPRFARYGRSAVNMTCVKNGTAKMTAGVKL